MGRLIQNEIKKPLADKLLFSELQSGGQVTIDLVDGKIDLLVDEAVS